MSGIKNWIRMKIKMWFDLVDYDRLKSEIIKYNHERMKVGKLTEENNRMSELLREVRQELYEAMSRVPDDGNIRFGLKTNRRIVKVSTFVPFEEKNMEGVSFENYIKAIEDRAKEELAEEIVRNVECVYKKGYMNDPKGYEFFTYVAVKK